MKHSVFVVVSGIPGSGKSYLGRQIAPVLNMRLLDKDDFLDRLLAAEPITDSNRRRYLSRKSDVLFQRAACQGSAAVLVSFWNVPGMSADSGTPTAWLTDVAARIASVHCVCPPEVAAQRFLHRVRHPGHGDRQRSHRDVIDEFTRLALLGAPSLPGQLHVETDREVSIHNVTRAVLASLAAT